MAITVATAVRTSRLQELLDAIDAGGAAGKIRVYTNPRPASVNEAASGTLLAELALSFPCAPAASGGSVVFDEIGQAVAGANGTATWARILTSANVAVMDLSVGISGTEIILDTATIAIGEFVVINTATIVEGAG